MLFRSGPYNCNALCDLGANISSMPNFFVDRLNLGKMEPRNININKSCTKAQGREDYVMVDVQWNLEI